MRYNSYSGENRPLGQHAADQRPWGEPPLANPDPSQNCVVVYNRIYVATHRKARVLAAPSVREAVGSDGRLG